MIQIPIAGLYSLLAAAHLGSLSTALFAAQTLIDYNPYVQIYFQ